MNCDFPKRSFYGVNAKNYEHFRSASFQYTASLNRYSQPQN